jgi:hypothetical protein
VQQQHAESILDPGDGASHHRRRQAQQARRLGEAAAIGDGDEGANGIEPVHRIIADCAIMNNAADYRRIWRCLCAGSQRRGSRWCTIFSTSP